LYSVNGACIGLDPGWLKKAKRTQLTISGVKKELWKGENKSIFCRKGLKMNTFKRFIKDERGLETVEWAVIAALIVAGLIAIITGLGQNVENRFTALRDATT